MKYLEHNDTFDLRKYEIWPVFRNIWPHCTSIRIIIRLSRFVYIFKNLSTTGKYRLTFSGKVEKIYGYVKDGFLEQRASSATFLHSLLPGWLQSRRRSIMRKPPQFSLVLTCSHLNTCSSTYTERKIELAQIELSLILNSNVSSSSDAPSTCTVYRTYNFKYCIENIVILFVFYICKCFTNIVRLKLRFYLMNNQRVSNPD